MAPQSSQGPNSLLNMLNPYASLAQSTYPASPSAREAEPDSPSTMLLRELQGGGSHETENEQDRERMSPTPTPTSRGAYVIASTSTSTSTSTSDDEGAPPASIMFGEQIPSSTGERTPRSPPNIIRPQPQHQSFGRAGGVTGAGHAISPGPFAPSSSSASGSRSRSTSPGPSTLSIYASGLDAIAASSSTSTSRDPSTSPDEQSARLPTFREPPAIARISPPRRNTASSKKVASTSPKLTSGPGYLDPSIPPPSTKSKGKAKDKSKQQGGRKYHAVPDEDDDDGDVEEDRGRYAGIGIRRAPGPGAGLAKSGLNDYEKALWKWVNVQDLDGFLQEVYDYYKGKGIFCIALARVLNLLTTFFVIAFSTFLSSCIDYTKLTSSVSEPNSVGRLDDVLVPQCITGGSFLHKIFTLIVAAFYVFQLASFALSFPRLIEMYRFYTHLLGVPDADIQTLPWPEIVRLIGEIRKHNPVTSLSNGQAGALAEMVGDGADQGVVAKLDAHDVANRILRQENYLIALFNKDLLDLRVRLPVPHSMAHLVPASLLAPTNNSQTPLPSHSNARERNYLTFGANTLTTALEWNLRFCLMGYLFDQHGQVRKKFVRERKRKDLVEGLRLRFIFMGLLNILFAPFIVVYLLLYSFFRYFEEYHKNPSSIGSRQYTPYAQWKFREFNELPHLFERRLDRSYPTAKEYIDQFPKERTALVMRFVAFVAGSFAAVLLVASLLDPDLFLHFEITPHRTVLFYLGIFGSVLAIARGMVPEENMVFDPEASLREVVRWTHYLPVEWKGKLHSQRVHQEFGQLFSLKITIFFNELWSVILTPFILLFSLPPCASAIIDFFREFTVHVDGLGYVCSFAVFDFERHGAADGLSPLPTPGVKGKTTMSPSTRRTTNTTTAAPKRSRANENKMEKSFLHFKATHPDWQPSDPSSSLFLDQLMGIGERTQRQTFIPDIGQGQGQGQMNSSIYNGAGGRGLGLGMGVGMDDHRLRERSKSYDRAWANSSHLLKNNHQAQGRVGNGNVKGEVIEEEEEDEASTLGWNKNLGSNREDEDDAGEEDNDEREGLWRDEGVRGLLQQVLGR